MYPGTADNTPMLVNLTVPIISATYAVDSPNSAESEGTAEKPELAGTDQIPEFVGTSD